MFSKLQAGMLALVAILVGGVVIPGLPFSSSALAQEQQTFTIQLSSLEEVPPTDSQATGMAQFDVMGEDSISYTVNATDIQAVTAGHIHSGHLGENGPVTLFNYDSPQDGVLEGGTITADNLEGPIAGSQLPNLIDAMNNGQTYVNIHTEQNPDGEIRGQIVTVSGTTG
jgi:hypothetical protein